MTKLLERLMTAFPDATLREFDDLGLRCYIVTMDGLELKVTQLHQDSSAAIDGTNEPNEWSGMTPRGPWDIRR